MFDTASLSGGVPLRRLTRNAWTLLVVVYLVAALVLAFPWNEQKVVLQRGGELLTGPVDGPYVDSAGFPAFLQLMNGTYMMWYSSQNHYSDRWQILAAISIDGIHWWPAGTAIPDFQPPWNFSDAFMPSVLFASSGYADSSIDMWFVGQSAVYGYRPAIYHAREYGPSWVVDGVALAPGNGTWDDAGISSPSVAFDGSQYLMYYSGAQTFSVGLAESARVTGFSRVAGGPVLVPGGPGAWDSSGVSTPSVVRVADGWKMYYRGDYSMGVATSTNGVNWTKDSQNPLLSPSPVASDWDAACICSGAYLSVGHVELFYYTGAPQAGEGDFGIGYAVPTKQSYPLWSVPSLLSGFLLGTAVSLALVVRVLRPWPRYPPVEDVYPDDSTKGAR